MSNIDGIYFRVERKGKWYNISFCDMTEEEINKVIGERSAEWWKMVAMHLRNVLNDVCEQFEIEVADE